MEFSTANLVDAYEPAIQSCPTQFRQYGARTLFHGRIRTLKTFEDNALIKQLVSAPGEGAVLVIDGEGSLRCALVGDVIAGLALANGWAGLVIYGAVRDSVALKRIDLGVKALGTNPSRSGKAGMGAIDVPLSIEGTEFTPGLWLYSDDDGLLVSRKRL
jgi:regulator of ribonuclease activity A